MGGVFASGKGIAIAGGTGKIGAMKFSTSIFQTLLFVAVLGLVACSENSAEKAELNEAEGASPSEATVENPALTQDPPGKSETAAVAAMPADVTKKEMKDSEPAGNGKLEIATLAGGCFWCTEAVVERLDGVKDVVSGYMGGHVDNPTYEQVCGMRTGHAEAIQVSFDSSVISYEDILDIFWQAHDPTTLNQQGADRGPQYRSAIFFHSPEQKQAAEKSKQRLDSSGEYDNPSVTEITEASTFWEADEDHQDYYRQNKDKNPYCSIVITPKMKKLGFE